MEVQVAERLRKLPPYLFADLRRKIAAARERGVKVVTLGIGDPDQPTPDPVIDELVRAVRDAADPHRHRYGCDQPVEQFPQAVRNFYKRRHGVALAPDQVVTTSGSKDAIYQLAMAVMNPGDMAIAPVPGYPTYNIGHVFASGVTYQAPLLAENKFLLDFDAIPREVCRQAKILWINYPNNPTTAIAPMEFFQRAVDFGRKHGILIAHDSAYCENTFDGYRSPSILQVPGADEVAVEFFSHSKAFNMTGWRAGFMAGNASAVKALHLVKDNTDNGTLRAIQFAATYALDHAETLLPPINAVYQRRRDMVVDALRAAGWQLEKPKATIYIWAPVPRQYVERAAKEQASASGLFCADLLEKTGVVVTPGGGYGQWGEGFIRISLTYADDVIREAVARIAELRL